MSETARDYSHKLIALAMFHGGRLSNGIERVTIGDIAAVCSVDTEIGTEERKRHLWMRVYGLESALMAEMQTSIDIHDKRRYCVPLRRLKAVYPAFDEAAARNSDAVYQPFLVLDEETGRQICPASSAFPVQGLVYDKETRRFL